MDNTQKFTNKVENYVRYRPSYPKQFIRYLMDEIGLSEDKTVADVGAGTGILTKLLAPNAGTVYAVEPNRNMRTACGEYCSNCKNVVLVDGTAEATTLPDHSADLITVAQAFHWFDRERTGTEFRRILKSGGRVVLVWNNRVRDDALILENDELCRTICPEFKGFSGEGGNELELYREFFRNRACEYRAFDNNRSMTLEEYIGGSLSSSYAPLEGDTGYKEFIEGLTALFHKYGKNGKLMMPNVTQSYAGYL